MYDSSLKYIAISYRWGEQNKQLLKTPGYSAHITSFSLWNLIQLCYFIGEESDLKEIPYLWIDAISVNQHDHSKKKETILKMNQIYKIASNILAVPDLHLRYLWKNTANQVVIDLIKKYNKIIQQDIFNNIKHSATDSIHGIKNSKTNSTQHTNHRSDIQNLKNNKIIQENEELRKYVEGLKMEMKEEELKKAYQFLAYLIND